MRAPKPNHRNPAAMEALEGRVLLAAVTVNAGQAVRTVNANIHGANLAWWDSNLTTSQTKTMVQAAGLNTFRFPGGSSSDDIHFNVGPTYNGQGTAASFASFIASVSGGGMVTLNYGTGSPQEAAAFLSYYNAPVGGATAIGMGQQWDTTSSTWVQKNWQTSGYWAALRAAAPLATDDGRNFLRISHPGPFAFHYYEIGNEEYGSWETDHHGAGGDIGAQHDAATYVAFAKQFAAYANLIDPTISIGIDSGGPDTWFTNVIQQGVTQGFRPGWVSDHSYMQAPGAENDATLLLHTVSDSTNYYYWPTRAANYRTILQQKLGANASSVELLATEHNSVYSNPGKQTTSLVNGLFIADSLGGLLQTEFNGMWVWDLRNGYDTANNNSASLYGWRQGGDYGLLGAPGTSPSTGTYVPYPTYFAEQLLSKFANAGDTVVKATSNDTNLDTFAVKQASGHLALLVVNKNATTDLTAQFTLSGFQPSGQAQVWRYGKTEDTAQSLTTDGHASLTNLAATLSLTGANFSYAFPSYSMTVLDVAPAATVVGRQLFYANDKAMTTDPTGDSSIATDLHPLLPNQTVGTGIISAYDKGIDGIMVDLKNGPGRALTAADFTFVVGATSTPGTWTAAPAPASIIFRAGAGIGGSERVNITWADGAIKNQWLQVTVKPDINTGLVSSDQFYFGNLVGDVNASGLVDLTDYNILSANFHNNYGGTGVTSGDLNGDGLIDLTDYNDLAANFHGTLPVFTAPAAPPTASGSATIGATGLNRVHHPHR